MIKPKVPTDAERVEVRRAPLDGLARGRPLDDVFGQLRPFVDHAFPFPADCLVEIAADALTLAGATRSSPISLTDAHERYLSEWAVSGNTAHQKSRAAVELAIAVHGGIVPDYDAAAGWWRVQDLAFYAFEAAVIMIRMAAERTGRSVSSICDEIASLYGLNL